MANNDPNGEVRKGEKLHIAASDWNLVRKVARQFKQGELSILSDPVKFGDKATTILVKNTESTAFERFGAVELFEPIFAPTYAGTDQRADFFQRMVMKGRIPAPLTGVGFIGIFATPCAAGAVAPAFVDGTIGAVVNVLDAKHGSADIKSTTPTDAPDSMLYSSNSGSIDILWKESGTGFRLAILKLGREPRNVQFLAEITGHISISTGRWKYSWIERTVASGELGYESTTGAWVSNSSTGGDKINLAINTIEWMQNASTTVYGPGIPSADIPTGLSLQPISSGTVVMMNRIRHGANFSYNFSCPNALAGTCA